MAPNTADMATIPVPNKSRMPHCRAQRGTSVLFCFRMMNACVLALLGALLLSSIWFNDFSVDRQLAHFLPASNAMTMVPLRHRWASFDDGAVISRLQDVRVQIHGDLCHRGNPDFLRAYMCGERAGI